MLKELIDINDNYTNIFKVSIQDAQSMAMQLKIPYIECSAKAGMNIDQSFHELVRIVRRFQLSERPPIKSTPQKSSKKCSIL